MKPNRFEQNNQNLGVNTNQDPIKPVEKEPRQVEVAPRVSENHFKLFFVESSKHYYMISPGKTIFNVNKSVLAILNFKKNRFIFDSLKKT